MKKLVWIVLLIVAGSVYAEGPWKCPLTGVYQSEGAPLTVITIDAYKGTVFMGMDLDRDGKISRDESNMWGKKEGVIFHPDGVEWKMGDLICYFVYRVEEKDFLWVVANNVTTFVAIKVVGSK